MLTTAESLYYFLNTHWIWSAFISFVLLLTISGLYDSFKFYTWYFIVLLLGLALSVLVGNVLYFFAFSLGMTTAMAEILGKFSDEPIKALGTGHALFYHILNGIIAVFALKLFLISGASTESELDAVKLVVVAGFGSMMAMRSKIFSIKVGGEDVAFGPEQVIRVFFRFMEAAIDRVRAQARMDFIKATLKDIDCDKVKAYSITMLMAAQVLDDKVRTNCETRIKTLKTEQGNDPQLTAYQLGFILLDTMGEAFVSKLFLNSPAEWRIRAPLPEKKDDGLLSRLLALGDTKSVLYMAYGSGMSSRKFRELMKWSNIEETQFERITKPVVAELENYRLVFNKPVDPSKTGSEALPNIVPSPGSKVYGVCYTLTEESLEFLDRSLPGYKRQRVTAKILDKSAETWIYVAEVTIDGLKIKQEHLAYVLEGAREHSLKPEYISEIERLKA